MTLISSPLPESPFPLHSVPFSRFILYPFTYTYITLHSTAPSTRFLPFENRNRISVWNFYEDPHEFVKPIPFAFHTPPRHLTSLRSQRGRNRKHQRATRTITWPLNWTPLGHVMGKLTVTTVTSEYESTEDSNTSIAITHPFNEHTKL